MDVRNTSKKAVEGLIYLVDEVVTVRIPDAKKPLEIRSGIVREKTSQFFVDKQKASSSALTGNWPPLMGAAVGPPQAQH